MAEAVAVYFSRFGSWLRDHEKATLFDVAAMIAKLKGCHTAGPFDHTSKRCGEIYYVPDDTLVTEEASELGIRSEDDFFGGIVSHPIAKTKAITHRLVSNTAERPDGLPWAFADKVRHVVLPGYAAFAARDACIAARRLLKLGPLRLKNPLSWGGGGQTVVSTMRELEQVLGRLPAKELAVSGLILEANLRPAITLSIGQVTIHDLTVVYHGTQRTVLNNSGQPVYGGSRLVCVRGGWEALNKLPIDSASRYAVAQARSYDHAGSNSLGILASRRNYDVGQGLDGEGQWRSGVLEASWRAGGASTAELAALTGFAADPALLVFEASTVKEFGKARKAPPHVTIHFQGDDPRDGPILRYTAVTRTLRHAA